MLDVAIDAAKQAGELALKYFKSQPKVSYKADKSPVTRADIEAEKLIRKIISKNFPDHGIIGEELGSTTYKSKYTWAIDPIDGTRYFAHRLPYWGTLLSLLDNNNPIIGIAYLPAMGQMLVSEKRKGAYLNNKKLKVSKTTVLKNASVANGSIAYFDDINKLQNLVNLYKQTQGSKIGIGGIYAYLLVAKGSIDINVDPKSEVYDIAAPKIIIEEAGGKFSDLQGTSSLTSKVFIATNGLLHSQVLRLLNQ